MRIAIDIHGTIDYDPEYWRKAIELLIVLGNSVVILSGPRQLEIIKRLIKLDIPVRQLEKILSVSDWVASKGFKCWTDKKGDFWTEEEIWNCAKSSICAEEEIDIMIDDKSEYFQSNKRTKYILYRKGIFYKQE